MECTPTPTSTRFGPQQTSTQHTFQTNVETAIVVAAWQSPTLQTSCVSTNSPSDFVSAPASATESKNGNGGRPGPKNERQAAESWFSSLSEAIFPTQVAASRAADEDEECAAWTTTTSWVDSDAATRTTTTEIMTWTWETFETQIPLETLFAPCPAVEPSNSASTAPASTPIAPMRFSPSPIPSRTTSNQASWKTSSATGDAVQLSAVVDAVAASNSVSSTISDSSVRIASAAAALQPSASQATTTSSTQGSVPLSVGGVGVINTSAVPAPETKASPNGYTSGAPDTPANKKSVDAGAVAGGVFGALIGLACLLFAYRWWQQRKRKARSARNTWFEKSYSMTGDYQSSPRSPPGSNVTATSERSTFGARLENVRHMAQNSLSGPFPPFFNTVRSSLTTPFGNAFKATPLHPAASHPTPASTIYPDDGPSLPVPPMFVGSRVTQSSPLRNAISTPQPFIGDIYGTTTAAATFTEPAGSQRYSYPAQPRIPSVNVNQPFGHDPNIVNSFPLPPDLQSDHALHDVRLLSMYSTPSYYGPHTSGQFEYSEYQHSGRESLATQHTVDRTTKAWYDKELWDGNGQREGVQSVSADSLYGGIGASMVDDRNERSGLAI